MNTKKIARITCGKVAFYPLISEDGDNGNPSYDTKNGWIIDNLIKVSVKLESSMEVAYGSGRPLLTATKTTGGEIEIETYHLPLDLKAKLCGQHISENKIITESTDNVPIPFGMVLENANYSDGKKEWCYFPNCMLMPSDSESETSEDKVKFQSDTYSIRFIPIGKENITRLVFSETMLKDTERLKNREDMIAKMHLTDGDIELEKNIEKDANKGGFWSS